MKQNNPSRIKIIVQGQNVPRWFIIMVFVLIALVANNSLDHVITIANTLLPFAK
jgi:uncharacterized paraquat-inducible protein A